MKNIVLLHGMGETPESFWYPWLAHQLRQRGYAVWAPQLPEADAPVLTRQLPFVLDSGKVKPETVIIAHSAGCPLALGVLERLEQKITQAILVAGFARPLPGAEKATPVLQSQYGWERIKKNVGELIFIHSDNDPWGCDDREGRYMFDRLGGMLIVRHGEGHMGSTTYRQPYPDFPLLLKLIS